MHITRHLPSLALQPYVRCFMTLDSPVAAQNRVLPATGLVLAVQYRGRVQRLDVAGAAHDIPAAALTGISHAPRLLAYAPGTSTLLVHFKELGAAAFFAQPLHELFGRSVALDELLPHQAVAALTEQLSAATTTSQRLALMEQFLLGYQRAVPPAAAVRQALPLLHATGGAGTMRALVAGLPLSRDPFEKQFRRLVGATPKQYASIVRLRWVLRQQPTATSLTELAHAAGYFDQAHFTHDFSALTGQAPKAFFAGPAYW